MTGTLEEARNALHAGNLVVYPTETVYGLGGDALNPDAVERVFAAKARDRSKPISMAVPDLETAHEYGSLDDREAAFVERFLPGPVTVVVEKRQVVPDVLTAGRDRVGIRIPDDEVALSLLQEVSPVTATSANRSGNPSARRVTDLDSRVRDAVSVVLDGGETPGGGSTVVDVNRNVVHRAGPCADEVRAWLDEH